jgi:hypothetical protein
MSIYRKINDEFSDEKKELSSQFFDLSESTVKSFDKITTKLSEENIDNSVLILTACQLDENKDNSKLNGGIMGRTGDIIDMIVQAMMKDDNFKSIILRAVANCQNFDKLNSDNDLNGVSALAIGPDGETIDLEMIPDNVKKALSKLIDPSKSSKKSASDLKDSLVDEFLSNDKGEFNDDIDELTDEDY